jgi:pyruvate,water dikinase
MSNQPLVLWFSDIRRRDVGTVGGKNASLGEMISQLKSAGIRVPGGFATTAKAYWDFIAANKLEGKIRRELANLEDDLTNVAKVGKAVRELILKGEFPPALIHAIPQAYGRMAEELGREPDVAVRSSATAEDLPEASFAGQLETFLNVCGEAHLLGACKRCFASLFTDRAISYRVNHGFDHMEVALSVGVQRMVRSDLAGSGVMFSIDTETGFPGTVLINAGWGLGETVVQGIIDPDEYHVFKLLLDKVGYKPIIHKALGSKARKMVYGEGEEGPSKLTDTPDEERDAYVLSDEEVLQLARWAVAIEDHYGQAMDMEWAKDGQTGDLYIVQARPETVQSRREAGHLQTFRLKKRGERLLSGLAIGDAIAAGKVCCLKSPGEIDHFEKGSVLVTEITDPDWVPIMMRAAAMVTDRGGRTSHAAIVSRELGLPAIVGAADATTRLKDGQEVTVSCAEGDEGTVYDGIADFEVEEIEIGQIPKTRTKVMINLANPASAFRWWRLGVSLVAAAKRRGRAGPHGVHHRQPDQNPSDGAGAFRSGPGQGSAREHRRADQGLRGQDRVLCRHPRPRHRPHCSRALPEPGDRAHERLQDQRICATDWRRGFRTTGGEPDARLARGQPLL